LSPAILKRAVETQASERELLISLNSESSRLERLKKPVRLRVKAIPIIKKEIMIADIKAMYPDWFIFSNK
jgi:hypothetical protein